MAAPLLRMHVDLKVVRVDMTLRTVHVLAGCLGAAAIVAAAELPRVVRAAMPPAPPSPTPPPPALEA